MNKFYVIHLWVVLLCACLQGVAQSPVSNVNITSNVSVPGGSYSASITSHTNAVNTIQPSTNYAVTYNNNGNVNIVDFTVSGKNYVRYDNFDTVILRRVANTWESTNGNKQQIYCQGPLVVDNLFHTITFPPAFPVVTNHAYMERVMKEGYINRGSDNVFNNDPNSDATANNIERVDFVYLNGVATTDIIYAGFLIAERGGNDPFKIAAITGIDANGNPTSYGPVVSVGTGSYGTTITSAVTYVLRKDVSDNTLRPFSFVSLQNIRGVYISFSHLGVAAMQKVYGYSLMANDVTATTSVQLLAFTNNTYYPRNTTTTNGGMDLASAPGIFHTDLVLSGHSLEISVQPRNCTQLIQWKDKEYEEAIGYQVERSYDRENFERIASVDQGRNSQYTFTDHTAQATAFYRVKVILARGGYFYSSVAVGSNACSAEKVSLYPNPVHDKLSVTMSPGMKITEMTLYSANGNEHAKWQFTGNEQQVNLELSRLPRGQYYISLKTADGMVRSYPVLKL